MKKGCYSAAWISGFFISITLLFSACSDNETSVVQSPKETKDVTTRHQPIPSKRPFTQLILDQISIDYPYEPDNSFTAFIRKLRARIDNKNMRAMLGELSPRFICQSPLCQKGLPIAQQFEGIFVGLGEHPWKKLLKLIDTKHYQQVDGHVCGPASANFIGSGGEQVAGKNWGYINGKEVRLRQKPSTKSRVVTHLSHDVVKLTSSKKIIKKGLRWIEVETLEGKKGFIAEKFFLILTPPQLCYQRVVDEWKISGFRSP
ncbi:MAG: SH3 domain-containing protein [Cocleimonas sp.]|nr:SH3 domain-containing protein [Cocleimonas sp.]